MLFFQLLEYCLIVCFFFFFIFSWDSPPFHKKSLKGIVFEGVSDEPIGVRIFTFIVNLQAIDRQK